MKSLDAPLEYVKNRNADPTIPPDRFAPFPGKNNYRSAYINSFDQLKMLRDTYGIKHVINLAKDSMKKQDDPNFGCAGMNNPCEPLWAAELGLTYLPVYMGSQPPSDAEWEEIKKLLVKGNTLIHCTHGVDRTGTIAARWRKEIEPDLTNEEVLQGYTYLFGGAWSGGGNLDLKAWVEEGQYDPSLHSKVKWSLVKTPVLVGVGIFSAISIGISLYFMLRK